MATLPFYIYDLVGDPAVRWGAGTASLGQPVTITYSFPGSLPSGPGSNSVSGYTAFNTVEQNAAKQALAQISSFTSLNFVQVSDSDASADLRFGNASLSGGSGIAHFTWDDSGLRIANIFLQTTGTGAVSNGSFVPASLVAGDLGGHSWATLIHEIGHALGLKHPFETNHAGDPASILPGNVDNKVNTIMSYTIYSPSNVGIVTGTSSSFSSIYNALSPSTYCIYDIAALQYLYGVNTSSAGNKTFSFSANVPTYQTISDTGPNNTIDLSGLTGSNRVDLTPGSSSYLAIAQQLPFGAVLPSQYNGTSALSIAYDVYVTNVTGGSGADTITGNDIANFISGRAGNDIIRGGGGIDTAGYSSATKSYKVSVSTSSVSVQDRFGQDGVDTLQSIEKLQFADTTIDTTWFSKTASLSAGQIVDLVELYIAAFNRAPDAIGLNYWGGRLVDGMSLDSIARSFFDQPETKTAYPASMSTADFVSKVYNNVLGRTPDTAGFNYWRGEFQKGNVIKENFLLTIINSARAASGSPADAQYLLNK